MKSADARLQLLHTTDAYQLAVIGLMVGEANFAAEVLGLTEGFPSRRPYTARSAMFNRLLGELVEASSARTTSLISFVASFGR